MVGGHALLRAPGQANLAFAGWDQAGQNAQLLFLDCVHAGCRFVQSQYTGFGGQGQATFVPVGKGIGAPFGQFADAHVFQQFAGPCHGYALFPRGPDDGA